MENTWRKNLPQIEIKSLNAYYDKLHVLKDVEVKVDEVKVDEPKSLVSIGEDSETKVEPLKTFNETETNKKLEEIISVTINDDDTETVDNFVSDISALMEKKGVEVEKEVKSYTLFDDASENE